MTTQNGSVPKDREGTDEYEEHIDENENVRQPKHYCGIGACRPRCMQPCANIIIFGVLLGLQIIAFMSYGSYYMGTVRTLERRFGFSSQQMGILQSMSDIIQTSVLVFIGYLGSRLSKPHMLSGLFLFSALGMLLTSLPYFIYGPLKYDDPASMTAMVANQTSTVRDNTYQMCTADNSSNTCSPTDETLAKNNRMTYNFYVAAFLLIGLGTSGLSTIGLSYLDENVKKEDSGIYMGVVGSMYAVGPIVGFLFASFTTSLPEDLRDDQGLSGTERIGCWWLGGILFACITLVIIILMVPFPKHLPDYYKYHKPTKKTKRLSSVNPDEKPWIREIKLFFRAFARLACNPAFVLLMCGNITALYIAVGILVNLTRYLEIHFRLAPSMANIAAAVSGAVTSALGGIISGVIMKTRKLQPPAYAAIIVAVKATVTICVLILMLLSCPQPDIQGGQASDATGVIVSATCNADCHCSRDKYQPVCPSDSDQLYFSPCHAGCMDNSNGSYSNCTCAGADIVLSGDYCPSTCVTVYPYLVILALALFFGAFSRPPATVLVFRIVDPELKAFALGIQGTLFNLLVFIPGPLVFGTLFDSSCRLWQQTCGQRGNCLLYDGDQYRFIMHGIVLALMFIAMLFSIGLYVVVRKRYSGRADDSAISDGPVKLAVDDNGYVNDHDESTDL